MKKILVVLLAVGLFAGFAAKASASDVKFAGQYYVVGVYEDNRALNPSETAFSRAWFWTRTRVRMQFKVAEGLMFTTRFDALEKQWGNTNWSASAAGSEDKSNSRKAAVSAGTPNLQENIEFEQAYVTFNTMLGTWDVGYQAAGEWGTGFANVPGSRPRIKVAKAFGPFTAMAIYEKVQEADASSVTAGNVDADWDTYYLAGIYKFKGGDAGVLYTYVNNATQRVANDYRVGGHSLSPYVKATFGPVYIESELVWMWGKAKKYEAPTTTADVDVEGLGFYILGRFNMGPAYFGAQYGFSSGDDGNDATKSKTGPTSTTQWVPNLIWGEANLNVWAMGGGQNTNKTNLHLMGVFAGYKVTPKLELYTSLNTMKADKQTAANNQSKNYGTELDVKATYKIYDNLSYMVGAGYLWTGDWYKGNNAATNPANDYLIMNRLMLFF